MKKYNDYKSDKSEKDLTNDELYKIGVKGKTQYNSLFNWVTIEKIWVEHGEIKIWKRKPFK